MSISALNTGIAQPAQMPGHDAHAVRSRPAQPVQGAEGAPQATRGVQPPSVGEVRQALDEIEKVIAPMAQALEFSIDDDSGRTVVKVMDTETDEVIRQMPSEEVLAISKALDKLKGLLLKQQA